MKYTEYGDLEKILKTLKLEYQKGLDFKVKVIKSLFKDKLSEYSKEEVEKGILIIPTRLKEAKEMKMLSAYSWVYFNYYVEHITLWVEEIF